MMPGVIAHVALAPKPDSNLKAMSCPSVLLMAQRLLKRRKMRLLM